MEQFKQVHGIDQSSMDERIAQLYIQELEKDITKKLKEKGYKTTTCKVKAQISDQEEETKITKIKLKVEKLEEDETKKEDKEEAKIKPVDTTIQKEEKMEDTKQNKDTKVKKIDIQNIKKFLIEEYGVNEKCLEIN